MHCVGLASVRPDEDFVCNACKKFQLALIQGQLSSATATEPSAMEVVEMEKASGLMEDKKGDDSSDSATTKRAKSKSISNNLKENSI
jgi:hypothetical protein